MPDKLENTNSEEMMLATAESDWTNQIAMLLIFALFANWGSIPNTDKDLNQ